MNQYISETHYIDDHNRPNGGASRGVGIEIEWQAGPLAVDGIRRDPNGAFVEGVIEAAIGRIEYYQRSEFHCIENAVALGHLKAAAEVLTERTRGRERRGVEGTHQQ